MHPVAFLMLCYAVDIYSFCVLVIDGTSAVNIVITGVRARERAVVHERYRLAVGAFYHGGHYIALIEFVIRKVIVLALRIFEPGVESARIARHRSER